MIDCGRWKLLIENYVLMLRKTDFAIFTVFLCVTSWDMYLTDKQFWKTSPNKVRSKSMPTGTSKQELFVTVGNAVNYCHKDIYYTCCKGPRCASETSYYKSFERNNLRQCQKQQKSSKTIYIFFGGWRGQTSEGHFSWGFFSGVGENFAGGFFPGGIFPDTK